MMDNILVENKKPEGRKNKYKYLSIGFYFLFFRGIFQLVDNRNWQGWKRHG